MVAGVSVIQQASERPGARNGADANDPRVERLSICRMSARVQQRLLAAPTEAGKIHSVFRRAVNILWHDGSLLTLQERGPLLAPFAVALVRLPRADRLVPGAPVRRDGGCMQVGGAWLDGEGAILVETVLGPTRDGFGDLAGFLASQPVPPPAPGLASPTGRAARHRLAEGIRRHDATIFLEGALGLIGLGEGLTPAGDDCLVGSLAVLRRFGRATILSRPETRRQVTDAARSRTTMVARDFLLHALDGEFAELVLRLFTARGASEKRKAVQELAVLGGTSGADTLHGIRLAAEALRW